MAASYCRRKHKGGGAAILLRTGYECDIRQDIMDYSVECVVECCAIEIKPSLLLINIYRADRNMEIFFDFMTNVLTKIKSHCHSRHVVITGDFNIWATKECNNYRKLVNIMLECNLQQVVNKPTRETSTTSSCIDLVFTNNRHFNLDVEDLGISDHRCVIYSFKLSPQTQTKPTHTYKRRFTGKNISSFKQELSLTNWYDIISTENDINKNYNLFENKLIEILNAYIPQKRTMLSTKNKRTWLTKGLKISCKHKRLLKIIINQTNNKIIKEHFKKFSTILKKSVKLSKKITYSKVMQESKNKTKTMWMITNRIISKRQSNNHCNIKLKYNNYNVQCPLTVANTFNTYFASVGTTPLQTGGVGTVPSQGSPVLTPAVNSMYLQPVTETEIYNLIQNLPNVLSCGIDDIPPVLIKACINELTPPLTFLINQSFIEGTFPDKLKVAKLKPILKKGTKSDDPSKYRPIALLPVLSKLFEKTMTNRIYNFLEKYNIFSDNQYGFRKKRSTSEAVFKYVQEILTYINDKHYAIGVLLDMSKAYDRVSHSILLNKLQGVGIRGDALKWIKSYLSNRKQCVQIDHLDENTGELRNILSEVVTTTCSIPQGSVMGCVLFLVYINDLPKVSNTLCVVFADDVSLLFKCKNIDHDTITKINNSFNIVKHWLHKQNLEINFKKTKIIQFRPHQKHSLDLNRIANSLNIEETTHFTLLGMTLDSHLNWKSHIEMIKSKLSKFIYALTVLKANTKRECALSAYYAYVYAWLRYGVIMWGHSTDANDIFIIQKKCLRIINNIRPRDTCRAHFIKENILTLPSIYILEAAMFVRQHLNLFKFVESTRRNTKLVLPTPKLEMFRDSPLYRCILIYNKIPDTLKKVDSDNVFKTGLRSLLLNECYYHVGEFMNSPTL